MPGAAGWTLPVAGAHAERGQPVPARRAGLAGGIPAVDHHQASTGPLGLVGQHRPEGAPTGVRYGLRQRSIADQAPYVKVLDDDHVVVADQARACTVQEVSAGRPHLPVRAGNLRSSLTPVGRPPPLASHASLVTGQIGRSALQVPRIGDAPAVTDHGEVDQAKINADRPASLRQRRRGGHLHVEAHIPAATWVAGDGDAGRGERGRVDVRPGPHQPQRAAGLGQPQPPVPPAKRAAGVVGNLPAATRLEPRVAGPAGEECSERGVLMAQGLLQRYRGHLVEPSQLGRPLHRGQSCVGLPVGGAAPLSCPAGAAGGQGPVPHHPHTSEGAVQDGRLIGVRVGPALVRSPHTWILPKGCDMGIAIPPQPEGRSFPLGAW
jgi:hypothetical protein